MPQIIITPGDHKMLYPPRPEDCLPRDMILPTMNNWICQLKHNDTRTVIHITSDTINLYNRHKQPLKKQIITPELQQSLEQLRTKLNITTDSVIDGGLLHDGTLIIWDILRYNGDNLVGKTYQERHSMIQAISSQENTPHLGHQILPMIYTPHNHTMTDRDTIWNLVSTRNQIENRIVLEGIVYKQPDATLEPMYKLKNNTTWQVKSRITHKNYQF
jgi:ATP-dependent DNA ligase